MNLCRIFINNSLVGKSIVSLMNQDVKRLYPRFNSTMATPFDMAIERKEFFNTLPSIIDDLAEHPNLHKLPVAKEWLKKVITETVAGGKTARGLTTVMAFKMIEKPEYVTKETTQLAHALGWCAELLQVYCIILDDIVDGSLIRRGKPAWYRREDVGMAHAVNDAILVQCCLHHILKIYFEKSPIYVKLYEAFDETLFYTCIGQFLDIKSAEPIKNYDIFTTEHYEDIIKYKAAYYTFRLPISIGMMLANNLCEESHRRCEEISLSLGKLFQIQDDYIDCFGDVCLTGKMGTDIQEGKCTWLAVNALKHCNSKNRTVFTSCYGSKEPAHIERIKQLYVQLELPKIYKQEEREMYNNIVSQLATVSSVAERELYKKVLDMTYDRDK